MLYYHTCHCVLQVILTTRNFSRLSLPGVAQHVIQLKALFAEDAAQLLIDYSPRPIAVAEITGGSDSKDAKAVREFLCKHEVCALVCWLYGVSAGTCNAPRTSGSHHSGCSAAGRNQASS